MITIDISERMASAFGYAPNKEVMKSNIKANIEQAGVNVGLSKVNQAIIRNGIRKMDVSVRDAHFADLTLKSTEDGTLYKFANSFLEGNVDGVIAPCPMLSFERDKNIKVTEVDNSNNVVVESWGCKQWKITMSGLLIDMDGHWYPSDKMMQIRRLFETNAVFDVLQCQVLDDLGVCSVYIDKLMELSVMESYTDTIKYKFIMWSINPVEFNF